ncbi:MAG TPA: hypothetical protein VHY09_00870 [Candidatus Methylacidiphilales bacterium]|nr:hypothetical protein [Candidatus Methylacidiphilales bacterium]
MKTAPRPALVAACCLVLAMPAAASTPNASIASPPHANADKSEAEATEMKAELQRAKDAVNSAKKAEDLDPVLFDLQKYQSSGGFGFGVAVGTSVAPSNQDLLRQLIAALEFTKQWQNYLSHLASGDVQQARNDLQTLSQNNAGPSLIPRSRILALMTGQQTMSPAVTAPAPAPEVPEAQKIIDGINTLDDLPTALSKLNDMSQQDEVARECAQHLAPMVEVYEDLKNGLPTSVNIDFMGGLSGAGVSVKANGLLLKFILQHYFDTYKGAPPSADETPAAYATRVKNDALAGQDWALLKKALTAHAYLYRNVAQGSMPDDEAAGVDLVITGLNQNQAGQYALAVESFLNALKSGTLDVPAKFIGGQLDAIKRDHPNEYDQGMESYLTPLVPQQPYYPGMNPAMFNPAFRAGRHRPGNPGEIPGQLTPALKIPGANAAATNAPSAAH